MLLLLLLSLLLLFPLLLLLELLHKCFPNSPFRPSSCDQLMPDLIDIKKLRTQIRVEIVFRFCCQKLKITDVLTFQN